MPSNVRQIGGLSLRDFKTRIRRMPITVARQVAAQAAPMLTQFAQAALASGRNVYGDPRPKGADGRDLTLVETGATKRQLRFVTDGGTVVRAQLGPRYARYLVGKYKILPVGDRTAMPVNWIKALNELARDAVANPARVAA
jgi:hypothetical protein